MELASSLDRNELRPGAWIGKYELVELLARGGMAEIYLVKSVGLHGFETRSVLKRLPARSLGEPGFLTMFFDEACLVASLRHPNIAQVFDIGQDRDSYFFVMEYLEGLNLRQLINSCRQAGTAMSLACAIQVVLGIAAGLHAAHEARGSDGAHLEIVHRDVSPTNVMVTRDGAVKLIDFGVAKSSGHRAQTEAGVVKGKYAYMAPEQCRAERLDRRTDLYALGVVLFELTTGHRPHGDHGGPELLHHIVERDCPDPRLTVFDYPEELAAIVNRLLHRRPEARFQSARDLHRALSEFAARNQMILSPFALASLVNEVTPPTIPSSYDRAARAMPRSSTRAETVSFAGSERLLARGTGARDVPPMLADESPHRRATSLPYLELAVGGRSALEEGAEELARGQQAPVGHSKRLFALGALLSVAALGVYLHVAGIDLELLIDYFRQLAA